MHPRPCRSPVAGLALALFAVITPTALADEAPLLGFSADHSGAERALEARFDAALDPAHLKAAMKELTAHPHHVGSPWNRHVAEWVAEQFRSFGFETRVEEFQVLFPTPTERLLEMTAPTRFKARLEEPALKEDATSAQKKEQLPPYNAFSIDGDVTGELVYVNYGVPQDYEDLAKRGIDVKGRIALARYGGSWRGIKPKVAAEHGAVGCIIFSDPGGDGYVQGDPYPRGGWRSGESVQRGSVADMPLYSGDPLTPGVGATAGARRLDPKDARTLTKIPVLPISYDDALPLLRALGGPMAPVAWRGSLPVPYHLGPGPARVHLKLAFDWSLKPLRDVIAVLPGAERPDEWIVRGNHHDGWVYGASDPVSGLVALLEEARGLGTLARDGWRPKRTIVYAAWDGEEPGLLGSTEWVEEHAEELQRKVAVYINTDSNARGFLSLAGSHTLERFINQVGRDVTDPERGISALERARALTLVTGSKEAREDVVARADLRLEALGSGSDFTPFLQHLGIASLNMGYGGEEHYGQYHSIYDSYDHFLRFVDPDFSYGVLLAKTTGRAVLRLADADTLPFEFTALADSVGKYAREIEELAESMRKETAETNRLIAEKTFEAAADPRETFVTPQPKGPVPYLNFAPLQNAVAKLKESADAYAAAWKEAGEGGKPFPADRQVALDQVLLQAERTLTRPEGLPGRPWYVHQVYAPGQYTGYGVKTLPAVREAIELRQFGAADEQIGIVAGVLAGAAAHIDRATAIVRGPAGRPVTLTK